VGTKKTKATKQTFTAEKPSNPTLHFSFEFVDWENVNSLFKAPSLLRPFLSKIHHFQGKTESEIRYESKGSHRVNTSILSKGYVKRLEILELEGKLPGTLPDELFSIRLTGVQRLFCYLDRSFLYVLWFDPDHRICPSSLKHT
jgi:hypothetical protein